MINNDIPIKLSSIPGFNTTVYGSNETSEETKNILKLNSIECKTPNNQVYKVIRYDKNFFSADLVSTYGLCRSVITNSDNLVVSFAPPKSVPSDEFIKKYPSTEVSTVYAEEFIEGTMVNAFWDSKIGLTGGWEIATRNTVGAVSSFYKNNNTKTFREMFLEAARSINLSLDKLNPAYCYSFVLQHPENRIVVPFKFPKLYLVGLYRIDNTDKNNITVYAIDINEVKQTNWYGAKIEFPKRYEFDSYAELIEKYASMNTPYHILGFVLRNTKTGERAKIRNPVYEQVRSLRGNQPKLQYQYICLRKENKVRDFLKFYPENKKEFSKFRDQIHIFTETLYENYVSCYIKKEKPLINFTEQYRTHMYNIHQIYMNELREKKMFVMNTTVIKYVNELHPSLLMFSLNYQMRKKNVDTIVADNNV